MNIKRFTIYHKLSCLWKVFAYFPVNIIARECTDWITKLTLDNNYSTFTKVVFIFIYGFCNNSHILKTICITGNVDIASIKFYIWF